MLLLKVFSVPYQDVFKTFYGSETTNTDNAGATCFQLETFHEFLNLIIMVYIKILKDSNNGYLDIDCTTLTTRINHSYNGESISDIDFSQCRVDATLYDNLLRAAIDYNPPRLEALIAQVSSKGDEEKKLAKKLKGLLAQYDIHSMVSLIKCIIATGNNND